MIDSTRKNNLHTIQCFLSTSPEGYCHLPNFWSSPTFQLLFLKTIDTMHCYGVAGIQKFFTVRHEQPAVASISEVKQGKQKFQAY